MDDLDIKAQIFPNKSDEDEYLNFWKSQPDGFPSKY